MARDMIKPRRMVSNEAGVNAALDTLGLTELAGRIVSEIPHDKRQLVSIARALAARPSVLLLDEPAAGLNSGETAALGRQLQHAASQGLAIVLIDHDMDLVLSVCDTVVVLNFGRPIAAGPPGEIVADQLVIEAYLGGEAATGHDSSNGASAR
jgi:branched-chain amino acid transport system ATP-binding protein